MRVTAAETTLHEASLAVWAIPDAVAAGERFSVKVGAKSSAGCALAGCAIAVIDAAGAVVAAGRFGDQPWPGTDALFWTEIELAASTEPGTMRLAAQFDGAGTEAPHANAVAPFSVAVVARPEHTLTVKITSGGTPIEEAYVRLGPHRAMTNASGVAALKLAAGRYELQVWKAGYDTPVTPIDIAGDAAVEVAAIAQPDENPDARWTA